MKNSEIKTNDMKNHKKYFCIILLCVYWLSLVASAQTASDKKLGGVYTLELKDGTYLTLMEEDIPIDTLFKNNRNGRLLDWFMEDKDTIAYIYDEGIHVYYTRIYNNKENGFWEDIDWFNLFYPKEGYRYHQSYSILLTAKFKDKNTLVVWDKYKKKQEEVSLPEIKRMREEVLGKDF
ncbi:MAG: hypothetical protein IPL35_02655 [Sphingobacteriales bacterium]|nr:hypothetical protein [Sphingobacteriales bacterium]